MKKLSLLILSFVLVVSFSVFAKSKDLTIGVVGPETGNLAVYGTKTLDGIMLAVDEINAAGGVNGKRLSVVHYDDRGDKAEAAAATQRLINRDKVCAIIGEPTSGATFVIGPIANRAKVILISAGATAKGVTDGKPFVFRDTLLDSDGAPATLKFIMDKFGWKNFALITSVNNDYSVGLSGIFKEAAKKYGASILVEQTVSDGDTDFSAQITAIKPHKPDAIIFTGYYPEGSLIMLEARKQGLKAPMVGGDGLLAPDLWKVGGDSVLGSIVYAGFSPQAKAENVQNFVKKMKERGKEADMFSAQGYDAVYLLVNAMKKAGLTSCTDVKQRIKMRDALAATKDFMGVSGKMSFDSEGNAKKVPFIQMVDKKDGKYYFKLLNE
ncbi:ABC transporter substrate-binding protein [Deferribacter abyssi]|uniref:ABC transporter substrate-binding protein n=1 Tax=Deferribacter abyssi TaxID=213806 RepID=UPI003C27A81C